MVGLPVQIVRQAYFCGTNSKSKFELLTFYSSDAILSTEIFEPKEAISCPVSMMNRSEEVVKGKSVLFRS